MIEKRLLYEYTMTVDEYNECKKRDLDTDYIWDDDFCRWVDISGMPEEEYDELLDELDYRTDIPFLDVCYGGCIYKKKYWKDENGVRMVSITGYHNPQYADWCREQHYLY